MHAQVETTSGIRGNVTDPSGAIIAGVSVKAKNQDTGGVWETVTNDAGFYSFPSLRPGTYTITTSHPGFKSAEVQKPESLKSHKLLRSISLWRLGKPVTRFLFPRSLQNC